MILTSSLLIYSFLLWIKIFNFERQPKLSCIRGLSPLYLWGWLQIVGYSYFLGVKESVKVIGHRGIAAEGNAVKLVMVAKQMDKLFQDFNLFSIYSVYNFTELLSSM